MHAALACVGGDELVMALSQAPEGHRQRGLRASVAALEEVYESALRRAMGE